MATLLTLALTLQVDVERVHAVVNGVPILSSDSELAELAELVPRQTGESDHDYRRTVVEALIALQLRWQDLESAGATTRISADLEGVWAAVVSRTGGAEKLRARLAEIGLTEADLRDLVRRAAIIQAYVGTRFVPFVRVTGEEIERVWKNELVPQLVAAGKPVPELKQVREQVEALLRERKLSAEVDRWTEDLEKRSEVVRFFR